MKLTTLAARNIRRNSLKYMMHFFSLTFSVFTVYSFLALVHNEHVRLAFTYDNRYRSLLLSFAVIIGVFVLFFLLSSNNSFIRARKKEISTYALFGMTNRKIGRMLFLETMIVGGAALLVGITAGIFFSKLVAMILLDISLASFTGQLVFSLDSRAIYLTVLPFVAAFALMGQTGLRVVNSFELVDLFKAHRVGENSPRGSLVSLLLSLSLIAAGYYLACQDSPPVVVVSAIPILLLVISGTYLFFAGGLPRVLTYLQGQRARYYRGVNLIAVSAFAHRVNSIGTVMATIAILSAVATTAIATGFTLYQNVEKNTYRIVGYDLVFSGGGPQLGDEISNLLAANKAGIEDRFTTQLYTARPQLEPVDIRGLQLFTSEGTSFQVYSQSVYNRLASLARSEIEPIQVASGQAVYIFPPYSVAEQHVEQALLGLPLRFSAQTIAIGEILFSGLPPFGQRHRLILSDEDFARLMAAGDLSHTTDNGSGHTVTVINFAGALQSPEVNGLIKQTLAGRVASFRTAYTTYIEALETFGLMCFIGFFMSVVFILMTASLLYFKQMMAAEEEQHQYQMLRKIGMSQEVEQQVITRRLLPVFFIPLVVGIIHSIFAMKTADTVVFSHLIPVDNTYRVVLAYSAVMYALYALIYALFYQITKGQYARAVRGK